MPARRAVVLGAAEVTAVFGVHLDEFTFLDEKGHLHHKAGFDGGGLLHVAGRVALDAVGALDNLQGNRAG